MYAIDWRAKAYKQLHKIRSRKIREELYDAAETLRHWPDCRSVKALTGHEYGYRMRVGDWRILFDVQDRIRIIMIQEVKKRDERTY
ncbi:MAG: type II toxin-antitoxin system RelE family toxin [Syntrophales bacterium]